MTSRSAGATYTITSGAFAVVFIEVKGRIYKGTIAAFLNGVQVANDNSDGDYNSSSITLVVPKNSSYSVNTSASYTSGGGLYIKEFIVG